MPNIIKLTPSLCGCSPIQIGYRVENDARAIEFDFTEWSDEYGSGAVELLVKRKGDQAAYPVALEIDGTVAVWNISDTDTSVPGYGKAEYTYTVGTTLAKTAVFTFFVADDLADTTQDPPDPYQTWVDTLTSLGAETLGNAIRAEDAADRAEDAQEAAEQSAHGAEESATNAAQSAGAARDMAASALQSADRAEQEADRAEEALEEFTTPTASAETLPEGSNATASYADGHFTFGIPRGATGATGPQGPQGEKGEQGEKGDKGDTGEVDISAIYPFLPTDTASGSIASFPDGADNVPVEALTVALEPIQDLNGQSSPYPAGGGANKFDISTAIVGVKLGSSTGAEEANVNFISSDFIPMGEGVSLYLRNVCRGVEAKCFFCYDANKEYIADSGVAMGGGSDRITSGVVTTVTGTVYIRIVCANTATEVACNYPSTVTTYSPYSNICPITGHTQCEVWRSGSNLLSQNRSEWEIPGQYQGYKCGKDGQTITLSITDKGNGADISGCYIGLTAINDYTGVVTWAVTNGSVTANKLTSATSHYVSIYPRTEEAFQKIFNRFNVMVNYGSTPTTYESPSIVHISIPLSQTVYGGTIDVVGGVCKVTMAMVEAKNLTWRNTGVSNPNGSVFESNNQNVPFLGWVEGGRDKAISNALEKASIIGGQGQEAVNTFWWNNARTGYRVVWGEPNSGSTIGEFTTFITENNVVFVGQLAEPIEIQLSDIPTISTLLGTNNIWSDSGDVDVTYRADIQKYITKVISEALA